MPRVLWVGDAVVSSGFSKCTHAVCDHLHAQGWDVHVLGINHFGDRYPYNYPIYTCYQPFDGGRDGFGVTRLPRLVARLRPDVVVLLNDPWNVDAYIESLKTDPATSDYFPSIKIVGWMAVDGKNQDGRPLNALSHVVTWTEFGRLELEKGGYIGPSSVVPLGVDTSLFCSHDRLASRRMGQPPLPESGFIVGVVGRNQPRKRLDLTLEYFAEWIHSYSIPDAYLFMHVAPTGDRGCDLRSLTQYYGLQGRVILSEPHIGHGQHESVLPYIYSAMDVYLSTSQAEGWGLPCLEAMACGIPCIVPDWAAFGQDGWVKDAAVRVPCTATALSAPLNSQAYTIGGIPDKQATVQMLNAMYNAGELTLGRFKEKGLKLASELSWDRTGREFEAVLNSIIEGGRQ